MAKGKSANPADAHRRAEKKKEQKKNKAARTKAKDFAIVKKETWDMEDEITALEAKESRNADEQARLKELQSELEKINKKKEEYVAEHPEHRKLVYKARRREGEDTTAPKERVEIKRNLFKKNGLPRHPERSIYYDPVMNPYGVAPPGMPYVERARQSGEVWSDAEMEEEDSDDDIQLPDGPPPVDGDWEAVDDDDDITMPEEPQPVAEPVPSHAPSGPPPAFAQPHTYPLPPPPPLLGMPIHAGALPTPPPGFSAQATRFTPQIHTQPQAKPKNVTKPRSSVPTQAQIAAASVFAEPELRDFKKEATAFVPASIKKKKAADTQGETKDVSSDRQLTQDEYAAFLKEMENP